MFKNYLKTAWRNLVRNKTFSLLNIVGLAVGIACASLIFLWIEYHLTYNHSIPDYNNIYEIQNNQTYGGDMVTLPVTSVLVKDALQQEFPGITKCIFFIATASTMKTRPDNPWPIVCNTKPIKKMLPPK